MLRDFRQKFDVGRVSQPRCEAGAADDADVYVVACQFPIKRDIPRAVLGFDIAADAADGKRSVVICGDRRMGAESSGM